MDLKSGALEELHHATPWCSMAFFIQKPGSPDEDPSLRLVGWRLPHPQEIGPQGNLFAVVDLCQGFHQISLAEESRDLFSIVFPTGKFRYTSLSQGCSVSSDFFNIFTDAEIRNKVGYYKNVDDILTIGH